MSLRRLLLRLCLALAALSLGGPAGALAVGEKLPKFTCSAVDGSSVSSADFSGRVVALCFTASWVKQAGDELAYLQGLSRELNDKNLLILPIVEREEKARAAGFLASRKVTLKALLDNGEVARLFGVNGLPDLFIVDNTGTVRARLVGYGPASPGSIRKAIVPLLSEAKPAKPPERKAPPTTPPPPAPGASEAGIPPALRAYAHLQLGAAHINIGDAFINAGQRDGGHYSEAIRELKAGLAAEPRNVDLLVWLGVAQERTGNQAEAVRQYQAALAIDGSNSYAREGLRRLRGLPPTPPPPPPATQVE